ncbi:hypothetical protein B5G12_00515 [Faecalibacterium sp. An58]|nr:hypothetical protein B5G12_00515 [Faecalibacterium sp. An58]
MQDACIDQIYEKRTRRFMLWSIRRAYLSDCQCLDCDQAILLLQQSGKIKDSSILGDKAYVTKSIRFSFCIASQEQLCP